MRQMTTQQLTGLLTDSQPPCISLYQPTHRRHPENQQDPIRYRNLIAEIESSLRQKFPTHEVRTLLEQFRELSGDRHFWNHRTDGLAILASSESFQVFEVQRTVPELVVVADSFHLKPLLGALQSADRYQILCLNRHEARLYEGNRYALDPVELANMPLTIEAALGEELTEQHLTVASYGAGAARTGGGSGVPPSVHGHGDKADEIDIDRDRFFRAIDRGILEHHSLPSGLPLMLAALPEYHTPFRKISRNSFLMAEGIQANPESLNLDELCANAWRIMEPAYRARLAKQVDDYQAARAAQLGSDDLQQAAEAAVTGRVDTLLVEDARQVPGKIDRETGELRLDDLANPEVDDVLDDLAELVLSTKGEVVVVPSEQMPSASGAAARFRF